MRQTDTFQPPSVSVQVNSESVNVAFGNPVITEYVERDPYTGQYTVTPSESTVTLATNGLRMTANVTVEAIPQSYVGSGVTRRTSSDLTADGLTVTVPSGYYDSAAEKTIGLPTWTGGSF